MLDPRPAEPQLLSGNFAAFALDDLERFSRAVPGAGPTTLWRIGSRALLDIGRPRPSGDDLKRRLAAQKRAFARVEAAGAGPRQVTDAERLRLRVAVPARIDDQYRR